MFTVIRHLPEAVSNRKHQANIHGSVENRGLRTPPPQPLHVAQAVYELPAHFLDLVMNVFVVAVLLLSHFPF